jgi:probable F420-dependent oxidoreductase
VEEVKVAEKTEQDRGFRFAVQAFSASSAAEWRDKARRAEALGYSALHLADHFLGPGEAITKTGHPIQELAAVPAMAAAAEATRELRIGCRVFCMDYRHPVILAKEAATIDLLSEGRLELGLGAGWLRGEYEAAGIPFDPPGERIGRLAETVELVKALLAEGPVEHRGQYFRVSGFQGAPRPVQRPHPPIMIGGGSRRVLQLAARQADIVSFNFNNRSGVMGADGIQTSTAEETEKKVAWVREAAGDRFGHLELEIGAYLTFVVDDGKPIAEGIGAGLGLSAEQMFAHPHALIGSVDTICEELVRRREIYGISYITVTDEVAEAFAPVVARLA